MAAILASSIYKSISCILAFSIWSCPVYRVYVTVRVCLVCVIFGLSSLFLSKLPRYHSQKRYQPEQVSCHLQGRSRAGRV